MLGLTSCGRFGQVGDGDGGNSLTSAGVRILTAYVSPLIFAEAVKVPVEGGSE